MATVICIDGLGGHPEITFGLLSDFLEEDSHEVIIPDTSKVVTHEDRVQLALNAYHENAKDGESIFFVGQSAGGSAVRIATERLYQQKIQLAGVALLSPAMPWGIQYMTRTLLNVMRGRVKELLLGRVIRTTTHEYRTLVEPGLNDRVLQAVIHRTAISGKEARTLAFFPPRLGYHNSPTLLVYGTRDEWINPRAQEELARRIHMNHQRLSVSPIKGAGHLTLASWQAPMVLSEIREWINDCER